MMLEVYSITMELTSMQSWVTVDLEIWVLMQFISIYTKLLVLHMEVEGLDLSEMGMAAYPGDFAGSGFAAPPAPTPPVSAPAATPAASEASPEPSPAV